MKNWWQPIERNRPDIAEKDAASFGLQAGRSSWDGALRHRVQPVELCVISLPALPKGEGRSSGLLRWKAIVTVIRKMKGGLRRSYNQPTYPLPA